MNENNNNQNDITSTFDPNDINENKGICVLAYLGWLLIIPLLTKKESAFVKFHCNQGLVLAIASTLMSIVSKIMGNVGGIGTIVVIFCSLVVAVASIFQLIGLIYAVQGKAQKLPLIGDIVIIK